MFKFLLKPLVIIKNLLNPSIKLTDALELYTISGREGGVNMGNFLKKVLSVVLICSLIFTTNAITTFAEVQNDETIETTIEETTTEEETTIEETTTEEEITIEETTTEEETTIEETTIEEETTTELVGASTASPEETTTEEETIVEEEITEEFVETFIATPAEMKVLKTTALFGDGESFKFKFVVPGPEDDPNPFGWFNSEGGPRTIEYSSEDITTNPVTIPVFYPAAWSGGWTDPDWINVGWTNESDGNNWISDDQLDTLVENWTANPTENITVRVNMSEIWSSSLKTPPTKTSYFVGEEIDPSGLVFEASDEISSPATWTKDIPYDEPQFERLYSYQLLDESEAVIAGNTVTAETKYCKFIYNTRNEHKVELDVKVPHTFTFVTNENYPENFGYFDADHTINVITYHSEQLDTHPIEIPLVYNIAYQDTGAWVDVGWLLYKGEGVPEEFLSDEQLSALVESWKNNATEDVKVRVNFDPIYHSSVKQMPDKVDYYVGEEIDPTGLILEVSDQIFDTDVPTWTKDIAYDAIQYKDLFAREILDADKNSLGWDTVTANAKYCRFRFKTSVYEDVEINILKAVSEISIKKEQDWKEYSTGERFDGKGLVINVKYDDNTTGEVAYNDKRILFLFDPYELAADTSQVNVIFGGQSTTTPVTMVNNAYVLYYYNKTTDSVHSIYTYTGDENNVISALDNAVSQGATGFYRIGASGYYDGFKKYNKDSEKTLTRDEALSIYREEYDGNSSSYIGASFEAPVPPTPPAPPTPPTPIPPSGGGGSPSGGGGSSPSVGPMGDLTKNPIYQQQLLQSVQINKTNNIPQTKLVANTELASSLLNDPENAKIPTSNITDENGNTGFGKWQKAPGTNSWYFLAGDMNANGTLGTAGFVSSGLYNLSWGSTSGWYSFDANGMMQTGWQEVNGKIYYFEPDSNSASFGTAAVGSKTIDGKTYSFDEKGALIS